MVEIVKIGSNLNGAGSYVFLCTSLTILLHRQRQRNSGSGTAKFDGASDTKVTPSAIDSEKMDRWISLKFWILLRLIKGLQTFCQEDILSDVFQTYCQVLVVTFCQDCLDLHQTFCQDGCVSDILSGGHFVRTGWICTRQIVRMCMLTRVYFWYIGHISGMFTTKFHNFDQISQF